MYRNPFGARYEGCLAFAFQPSVVFQGVGWLLCRPRVEAFRRGKAIYESCFTFWFCGCLKFRLKQGNQFEPIFGQI